MQRRDEMSQAQIDRQAAKVARLSRELRFELLILRRMRSRRLPHAPRNPEAPAAFASLSEVYAAALTRRGDADDA